MAGVRSAGFDVVIEDPEGLVGPPDDVRSDGTPAPEPPWAVQAAAYRIVQEALTNVLRHAEASHAVVRLERGPGELEISILDDGRGIAETTPGGGILGMRGRAELLGGRVDVGAPSSGGTRVEVRLPWREGS